MASLTAPVGSLELELHDIAVQAAARGTAMTIEIEPGLDVSKSTARELAAIARGAVADAVDHGAATRVTVDLRRDGGLRLRTVDNGRERDPSPGRRNGSEAAFLDMDARARALGGELCVTPIPDGGTEIEVVVP
jgi:signal transduction histidine kinase